MYKIVKVKKANEKAIKYLNVHQILTEVTKRELNEHIFLYTQQDYIYLFPYLPYLCTTKIRN